MPTPSTRTLQISPDRGAAPLTSEQKRFNRLVGQIDAARRTLAQWQAQIPLYQQAHVQRLEPLLVAIRTTRRSTVLALDALLNEPGWSRTDRKALEELVCERAAELIGGEEEALDAEMRALFEKHAGIDFATAERQHTLAMKDAFESLTGVDLGDDDSVGSTDEVWRRLQGHAEREAAAAAERRQARKKTAAERRKEAEAQQATQSVRQVFRQLASALHPDRESDEAQRAAKTAMMQRANTAYAANDLLALLELQLEIEQIDARHLDGASAERLKHYNRVLAEQLEELKREIEATQLQFELSFGVDVRRSLRPDKLGALVDQGWRELTAALDSLQREQRSLASRASAKAWLKAIRQRKRLSPFDDEGW